MEINKIYNEDCLIGMQRIEDKSIDCIICDLPYGTTACKWDSIIPFEPLWEQYNRIIKDNGAIVLFGSEPFSSKLRMSNLKNYKYDWVWDKKSVSNPQLSKIQPMKSFENVIVFGKKRINYYPQGLIKRDKPDVRKNKSNSSEKLKHNSRNAYVSEYTNYPSMLNSLKFPREYNNKTIHATQKPVSLIRYLIKTYSNEWDTILDNCMGSGTTAIACIKENRNFIGFELNKEYYEKSLERINTEKARCF